MRRRILLVLLVGAMLSTAAAADIGQPSSFSVTISRDPGTVNLDLLVATQNPAVPAASDAMQMGVFLFAGGFPPTFVATPQITTVPRGLVANQQFAASFSLAVPNPQLPFKYLAMAAPYGVGGETLVPSSYASVLSFLSSAIPAIDLIVQATPAPGATPPPVWLWAKGELTEGVNIPALSLAGLLGLGALMALAGALLLRRP